MENLENNNKKVSNLSESIKKIQDDLDEFIKKEGGRSQTASEKNIEDLKNLFQKLPLQEKDDLLNELQTIINNSKNFLQVDDAKYEHLFSKIGLNRLNSGYGVVVLSNHKHSSETSPDAIKIEGSDRKNTIGLIPLRYCGQVLSVEYSLVNSSNEPNGHIEQYKLLPTNLFGVIPTLIKKIEDEDGEMNEQSSLEMYKDRQF